MVTMMQVLVYFELIIYIYIVCNRVFVELHDRTACKAYLLRRIFRVASRFRVATRFRRPPGRRENRRLKGSSIVAKFDVCHESVSLHSVLWTARKHSEILWCMDKLRYSCLTPTKYLLELDGRGLSEKPVSGSCINESLSAHYSNFLIYYGSQIRKRFYEKSQGTQAKRIPCPLVATPS